MWSSLRKLFSLSLVQAFGIVSVVCISIVAVEGACVGPQVEKAMNEEKMSVVHAIETYFLLKEREFERHVDLIYKQKLEKKCEDALKKVEQQGEHLENTMKCDNLQEWWLVMDEVAVAAEEGVTNLLSESDQALWDYSDDRFTLPLNLFDDFAAQLDTIYKENYPNLCGGYKSSLYELMEDHISEVGDLIALRFDQMDISANKFSDEISEISSVCGDNIWSLSIEIGVQLQEYQLTLDC